MQRIWPLVVGIRKLRLTHPTHKANLELTHSLMASSALISDTQPWKDLKAHVDDVKKAHLRDLLSDDKRCQSMLVEFDDILLDYARQQATPETIQKLFELAEAASLKEKINRMYSGEHINSTENRSVLHVALRAFRDAVIESDGKNVVPEVWKVLDKIQDFSERVRNGSWVGATGKALKDAVAVGIGENFLGPLFVHTALQTDPEAVESARGRQLRFLANVDPIDVARNITGLNPETTLVVVVSKTFTTAETMLNARTLREWISSALGPSAVAKHMVAVSTNLTLVEKFGIDPNNAFAFWDWVGGRYSVCSAVGVLPLSLQYGFSVIEKFLRGASSIDQHFYSQPFESNIPVLLGLLSIWNVSFLGYPARASMESNGKGVSIDGVPLPFEAGEIDFGEPGTNGQHSFYQLIHQGRVIPCDFIGVVKSQQPLLAIYEHRIAVEGFIWGINSFDQWGVELGKSLATQVRKQLNASRTKGEPIQGFNFSTTTMLTRYLQASSDVPADLSTVLPKI
ncbi:Glucose-6-phosphate isomerase, cytosolic [Glycine soja]